MSEDENLDDLMIQWEEALEAGHEISAEELCQDHPELVEQVRHRIKALKAMGWMTRPESVQTEAAHLDQPRLIAGRYRLDALVGEGGFAQVWRGYDLELQRPVAVKVPKPARRFSSEEIERFLTEARRVASLRHSGIVAVHDVVRVEGAYVIVTDLIDGSDMGECLRRGPLAHEDVVRIVSEIARSLDHAHRQNVVHCDIKPSNVLIDTQGRPLVCDFGIAVSAAVADPGERIGTLPYCSPEQVRGQPLDLRTDIWSLGVVLYQALSGKLPFDGDNPAAVRQKIGAKAPTPPRAVVQSIPKSLERICLKCLAKRPEDRYPTAAALADDLDRALRRRADRLGWAITTASFFALLAVLAVYQGGGFSGRDPKAVPEPPGDSGIVEPPVTQTHAVQCVQFSPDGRLLSSGGADAKVRLWEVGDGLKEVAALDQTAGVRTLLFSTDGKMLLAGCDDGSTRYWDLSKAKPTGGMSVSGHKGPVNALALSSDGKILVTGGADGTTRVYLDPAKQTHAAVIPKAGERICSVTLTPKADKLLVGVGNGLGKAAELNLWDIHLKDGEPRLTTCGRAFLGTVEDSRAIAASPNHDLLVAATGKKAYIWDRMRLVGNFDGHSGTILSVVLAPGFKHVLSCDEAGDVIIWTAIDLREVHRLKVKGVRSVAVAPTGSLVAIGCADGTVHLWRLPSPLGRKTSSCPSQMPSQGRASFSLRPVAPSSMMRRPAACGHASALCYRSVGRLLG